MHKYKHSFYSFLLIWSSSFAYCPFILTSAFFGVEGHADLSYDFPSVFWHPPISDHSKYFLITLIVVLLLFFFHLVSPEVLSTRFCHHLFLTDDPSVLVLLLSCCYNIWFSVLHLQCIIISDSPAILIFYPAIYFLVYSTPVFWGMILQGAARNVILFYHPIKIVTSQYRCRKRASECCISWKIWQMSTVCKMADNGRLTVDQKEKVVLFYAETKSVVAT